MKLAAKAGEGAFASQPGLPLEKMPGGKAFAEKYKATFKMEIQLWAAYAYDATRAMLTAMKKADSADPARYLPVLARLSYAGVTGTIAFDENGDLRGGSITLYQVKDGRWRFLETAGGAEPCEFAVCLAPITSSKP